MGSNNCSRPSTSGKTARNFQIYSSDASEAHAINYFYCRLEGSQALGLPILCTFTPALPLGPSGSLVLIDLAPGEPIISKELTLEPLTLAMTPPFILPWYLDIGLDFNIVPAPPNPQI
jgi:hypothetical protein